MAMYKYVKFVVQSSSNVFDTLTTPGTDTPYSGIYRCESCGLEATSVKGKPMPPPTHHKHASGEGAIKWRLVVATHHIP